MLDFLQELKTIGLTALFNPTFLFLLIVLFFIGRLVGWMTRSINVWKFLALGYFGIFLFRPLQDAGLIIGGVFILGVASMYMDLFRGIFGWAGGLGDVVSAFRSQSAYEDIWRLEREIEALKGQLHASQASPAAAGASTQQASWRAQSQARKSKPKTTASTGGRGDGGSSDSTQKAQASQEAKPSVKPRRRKKSGGRAQPQQSSTSSRTASPKPQSRSQSGTTGKTQQKPSGPSAARHKPSASGKARPSGSQSSTGQQNPSQSQSSQHSSSGQQQRTSQQQNQSGTTGSTSTSTPPALRDKYLTTLELIPGQTYSEKDLKAAWRKMAFKTHPDRGGSAAAFAQCLAAYRALT
jgi:hypothetical protein